MKKFNSLSEPMKIAYITAAATLAAAIIGAIIGGIFLLRSTSANQTSASTAPPSLPVTTGTAPSNTAATSPPVATQPVTTNASTPTEALTTFCNAMGKRDYPTAYNQLSSRAQQHYGSESDFARTYSLTTITNCTFSNVQQFGSTGTAMISFIYSSGEIVPLGSENLVMENGVWKIDLE